MPPRARTPGTASRAPGSAGLAVSYNAALGLWESDRSERYLETVLDR